MSNLPAEEDWITVDEIAKKISKGRKTVINYRDRGLLNQSRDKHVKLQMWKTFKGYVSTQEAIRKFHEELNS